ncbi:MAG: helix-turn-helix domain-containing protein [Streptosporangiales bacterium]|nr:helix-turn-helix domain-containing protein [Streptosporangiales bacterium]
MPDPAIESVDKALQVLLLLRRRGQLRVTEVSDDLGVARSTAHRLLSTLTSRGFLIRDPLTRAYRSGRVLIEIGLASVEGLDIRPQARPYLEALSARLHETVNLVVLEGSSCRFLDGVAGDRTLLTRVRTGTLLPAHTTSGGKVLLAELPPDHVRALYPHGLPKITEHTITDRERLRAELDRVREQGYAVNFGESEPGISALAVPVRDRRASAVAALAVSMPSLRMRPADVADLVAALRDTAAEIGRELP